MKYILKNIKSFARNYTKIFVLLVITIAASTLIIHLSYGMFREFEDRRELSRRGTNQVVFRLESSYAQKPAEDNGSLIALGDLDAQIYVKQGGLQDVTVADVKRFAREVDAETADKLLNIHTGILQGDYRFETDFLISDGEVVNSGDYGFDSLYNFSFGGRTQNTFEYGRYFTDQEYAEGERVCIMYGFQKNCAGTIWKRTCWGMGRCSLAGRNTGLSACRAESGQGTSQSHQWVGTVSFWTRLHCGSGTIFPCVRLTC